MLHLSKEVDAKTVRGSVSLADAKAVSGSASLIKISIQRIGGVSQVVLNDSKLIQTQAPSGTTAAGRSAGGASRRVGWELPVYWPEEVSGERITG